jgi:hypothetical protein
MVLELKKGANKTESEAIEKELYPGSSEVGFDAKKYNGVLSLNQDPFTTQIKLRREWERDADCCQ